MTVWQKLWAVLCIAIGLAPDRIAAAAEPPPFWVGVAQAQLTALQSEFDKLGPARIEDGIFYFGATKIDGNNALAEQTGRRAGAFWIYRREGARFAAIATNMHSGKGGYDLDRPIDAAATAALRKGEPYYGTIALAPDLNEKAGFAPAKARDGSVIGAYLVLVADRDACSRNLAPAVFPDGPRRLVSIDGAQGFDALNAQIRAGACNGVSITWREACNTDETSTRIGENGEIIDRIAGAATTRCGCAVDLPTPGRNEIAAALHGATRWRIDDDGLLILEGSGHRVVFDRGARAVP